MYDSRPDMHQNQGHAENPCAYQPTPSVDPFKGECPFFLAFQDHEASLCAFLLSKAVLNP